MIEERVGKTRTRDLMLQNLSLFNYDTIKYFDKLQLI